MTTRFALPLVALVALMVPGVVLGADEPPPVGEPLPAPTATPEATETAVPQTQPGVPAPVWGLGVGLGWNLPADLGTPNTVSVRIRKGSFTVEPAISVLAAGSISRDDPDGGDETLDRVGGWSTTIGVGARKQVATRGHVGLVAILVPSATFADSQSNPDGTDNAIRSTSFGFSTAWGAGVEYFPLPEWSLSLDATSPLATLAWARTYEMESNLAQEDAEFTAGIRLVPDVRAMAHLHF